jgi:hypothetical protein
MRVPMAVRSEYGRPFHDSDEDDPRCTPFQAWLHRQLKDDEEFRKRVEARMAKLDAERRRRGRIN